MPLTKTKTSKSSLKRTKSSSSSSTARKPVLSQRVAITHVAFIPILFLVFVMWVIYRSVFKFPVWFDETIGKAVFFGIPVWLYISLTKSKSMVQTFSPKRLIPGLFLGLAVGGILGFCGVLASIVHQHVVIQAVPLYASDQFWWQFFLAIMTGFWETLFFYCWVMVIITEKYAKWPLINQLLMVSAVFLLFHIPNTILRFQGITTVASQLLLLFFFALGQSLLFVRYRNLYALALSQAIWGMVILIYTK